MRRILTALFVALWILPGCAQNREVVAIGDSVMAWNGARGQSIADATGAALGVAVDNRAIAGARFSNESDVGRALGFDIRRQLGDDRPALVLMTAGANDLRAECDCGACGPVRDSLIGPDLTGELPDFARGLTAEGTTLVYVGYYYTRARSYMAGCTPDFDALHDRMAAFAERTPGILFVSAREVMDRDDDALYSWDNVHPSPRGSAAIGRLVAGHLREAGLVPAVP